MTDDEKIIRSDILVDVISAILADEDPQVVGSVLGELLSILLRGYIAETPAETLELRQNVSSLITKLMWDILAISDNVSHPGRVS